MGKIIYTEKPYAIQEVFSGQKKGYILFNMDKEFQNSHSHLNNFKSAKYLIKLMQKEILPYDLDLYRLESICRVSKDGIYKDKALSLFETKKCKPTKKYVNIHAKCIASC